MQLIENGFLASRLEIFTRYHSESLKKLSKCEQVCCHEVTDDVHWQTKQFLRLILTTKSPRSKLKGSEREYLASSYCPMYHQCLTMSCLPVHDTYQKKKDAKWWDVEVRSTDYESFSILSRVSREMCLPLPLATVVMPCHAPFLLLPLFVSHLTE